LAAGFNIDTLLSEDCIFLPKYVGALSLLFICISYGAFGWYNKRNHWCF